jgi:cytidine deaminase
MSASKRTYNSLVQHARKALHHSHAPFSGFRVGAALLATNDKIYHGCNIENSSYGLTICAERTAIFRAISDGVHKFKAIAIVSDEGGLTSPCGACRQVLSDLAGNIDVVLADHRGRMKVFKLKKLLPHPFTPENLRKRT